MTEFSPRTASYRFGLFEVFPESGELRRQGVRVKIQEQPFRLLVCLLERSGEIVSRENLTQELWPGDTFVEFDQSLAAAMMKLRQALDDDADNPRFVETVPRRGYRFLAPVTHVEAESDAVRIVVESSATATANQTAQDAKRKLAGVIALAVALSLLAVAVALWGVVVPPPQPRVLEISQITHDGFAKHGLATDGMRVYTVEDRSGKQFLVESSLADGEAVPSTSGSDFFQIRDIAANGSRLLITNRTPTEREGSFWTMGLPGGDMQRIGNVSGHDGAWSPDGRQMVFSNGSDLFTASADGTSVRKLAGVNGSPFGVRYSPDGSTIRFAVDSGNNRSSIWEARADGLGLHALFADADMPPSQCCGVWSPDGRLYFFIAASGPGGDIWVLPKKRTLLRDRKPRPTRLTNGPLFFEALAASPDGHKLYAQGFQGRGELVRYDANSRQFIPSLGGISAGEADFSRDGKWVAYISYPDATLWRCRIDGSDRLQLTHAPFFALLPRWSPDGKQISFVGAAPGAMQKAFVVPADGGVPEEVYSDDRSQTDVTWSPDGKALAFGRVQIAGVALIRIPSAGGNEKLEINVVDLRSHRATTIPGSEGLFSPRWSPDGRYIAAMTADSTRLVLFDFETHIWRDWTSKPGETIASPNWSRDSRYIYYATSSAAGSEYRRIRVGEDRPETVVDLASLHRFIEPHVGPWSAPAPDGSPLFVRDLSTDEIYSLDLQLR